MAQRQFVLVAKVLQNLANDTLPGDKESYMEQLNTFIINNKAGLATFYSKILTGADRGKPAHTDVPQRARQASLCALHKYLSTHLAAVERAMQENAVGDEDEDPLLEELKSLLATTGDENNV